jgi:hypothetical protein
MVEPLGPPVEQPVIISDMVPATKTGYALIMGLFAVKIILCERDREAARIIHRILSEDFSQIN